MKYFLLIFTFLPTFGVEPIPGCVFQFENICAEESPQLFTTKNFYCAEKIANVPSEFIQFSRRHCVDNPKDFCEFIPKYHGLCKLKDDLYILRENFWRPKMKMKLKIGQRDDMAAELVQEAKYCEENFSSQFEDIEKYLGKSPKRMRVLESTEELPPPKISGWEEEEIRRVVKGLNSKEYIERFVKKSDGTPNNDAVNCFLDKLKKIRKNLWSLKFQGEMFFYFGENSKDCRIIMRNSNLEKGRVFGLKNEINSIIKIFQNLN